MSETTITIGLLVYVAIIATIDLLVDAWGAKAKKARVTLNDICDEAIALAEQRGRSGKLDAMAKHRVAVAWAEEQCKRLHLRASAADLSKRIEVRLSHIKKG